MLFRLIPETKGHSLEEMDALFGAVSTDQRMSELAKQQGIYFSTLIS